jgi:hypothetical protein
VYTEAQEKTQQMGLNTFKMCYCAIHVQMGSWQ